MRIVITGAGGALGRAVVQAFADRGDAVGADSRTEAEETRVNAILPAILDTPRNRADMPDADPSDWTSPAAIADVPLFLAGPQARAISGVLIPVAHNG